MLFIPYLDNNTETYKKINLETIKDDIVQHNEEIITET